MFVCVCMYIYICLSNEQYKICCEYEISGNTHTATENECSEVVVGTKHK